MREREGRHLLVHAFQILRIFDVDREVSLVLDRLKAEGDTHLGGETPLVNKGFVFAVFQSKDARLSIPNVHRDHVAMGKAVFCTIRMSRGVNQKLSSFSTVSAQPTRCGGWI